jgi:putative DNA methylase
LWWARRRQRPARAVVFAQMVDDSSSYPEIFNSEKAQEKERERLLGIIKDLVRWENTTNEELLDRARKEILQSWRRTCATHAGHPRARELFDPRKLPVFHDPSSGGGTLAVEAQRRPTQAILASHSGS